MVANKFWVLLLVVKTEKLAIRLEKNICWLKEDKIYLKQAGSGSYCKEEWLEEFLGSKGAFYNGNESDNDDESYIENNEYQQLPKGFANSFYKIVSPYFYKS